MRSDNGTDGTLRTGRTAPSGRLESIRDRQRRRRDAQRVRAGMEAVLATPDLADEEEEDDQAPEAVKAAPPPPGPAPAKVFVVFRGAKWDDPDGALRESDSIAGVYGSEEAARRAVVALKDTAGERQDAWYQPYPLQS